MSDKASRKELLEKYKEMKTRYGIFQITNNVTGKIYIDSAKNLRAKENSFLGFIESNPLVKELCEDCKIYGKENFTFQVLEEAEVPDDKFFDISGTLDKMLGKWLDKLEPYGEKGYNKQRKKI